MIDRGRSGPGSGGDKHVVHERRAGARGSVSDVQFARVRWPLVSGVSGIVIARIVDELHARALGQAQAGARIAKCNVVDERCVVGAFVSNEAAAVRFLLLVHVFERNVSLYLVTSTLSFVEDDPA